MAVDTIESATTEIVAVEAELQFALHTTEKPYTYAGDPPGGVPKSRGEHRSHKVRVENARPIADRLSVDVQGFAVVHRPTTVANLFDEAQTLALGHPETADLVKEVTGASRVVVFDHTVRRRTEGGLDREAGIPRQPVARVHVDQTDSSGPKRVREIMGAQAEQILGRRAAIINVWRPIAYPARDWPLVLGDARSFQPQDLIATDLIFPHRRGETYGIAYNADQRWLYVPDLRPEEAILIKCWDSDPTLARFAPHSGFADPTTPAGTPPRQSIEFRTIAFFD
ncbi:CmcJ/NvfI family oxidoreductase [Marinivivus vitaminiproducens]|uniref:CmcJ/NvfI family oxidoreductase n=1 Tax=Marinivivus vitaminiproducens TaxID=3035935 RepID=UPI00279C08C9|nr:CmcJ/NvfI family oxidoreductase [Geminicoccaceae bacterium SCSIO 64248]